MTTFDLISDALGRLTLRRAGLDDVHDVRIRRTFPWSRPNHFISIRGSEGRELLMIDDLAELSPGLRELIERNLARTVFIPRIVRIESVNLRFGHQWWKVRTDRGPIEFRVQEREDIRFLPDGRFSLKDADGNIYEMPRLDDFDDHSRRAVEALL